MHEASWIQYHMVTDQDPKRIVSSYEEHRGIADAIVSGNADLAVQRLIEHFEYGKQHILTPRGR